MSFVTKHGVACSCIPKVGSNSLSGLKGIRVCDLSEANDCAVRLAFIRNPLDRLVSAYSFLQEMTETEPEGKYPWGWRSYEAFVDDVLSKDDVHWRPQETFLVGYNYTAMYRSERMTDVWEREVGGSLPVTHRTAKRPVSDYRFDELLEKYKGDMALWHLV